MGDSVYIQIKDDTPRWLKLRAAAKYSSLGVHQLKALAEAGEIVGGKVLVGQGDSGRRDWMFDRFSLDAYLQAQLRPARVDAMVGRIAAEMGL